MFFADNQCMNCTLKNREEKMKVLNYLLFLGCTILLVLGLFVGCSTTPEKGDWELGPELALEPSSNTFQRWPKLVSSSNGGSFVAIWKDQVSLDQEESRVMDVSWSQSQLLRSSANQTAIVTTSSGYALAWVPGLEIESEEGGVFTQLSNADFTPVSDLKNIGDVDNECSNPSIVIANDGYWIAWDYEIGDDNYNVGMASLDPEWNVVVGIESFNAGATNPVLVANSNATFVIHTQYPSLVLKEIDQNGEVITETTISDGHTIQPPDGNSYVEDVEAVWDGSSIAVAWTEPHYWGGPSDVFFARFSEDGQAVLEAVVVAEQPDSKDFISPRISLAVDGENYFIAWEFDADVTSGGTRLWGTVLDAEGKVKMDAQVVAGLPENNVSEFSVASRSSGLFGIFWLDSREDPIAHDPWFRTLTYTEE